MCGYDLYIYIYIFQGLRPLPPAPLTPFWHHIGTCGGFFASILVTKWGKDAHRGSLVGPSVDLWRFLMDYGSPIGVHFESLFDIF